MLTDITFAPGTAHDVASGLLAYVAVTLPGDLRSSGWTLRRTLDGRLTISFPIKSDRRGGRHPVLRPLSRAAHRRIEEQIIAAWKARGASS